MFSLNCNGRLLTANRALVMGIINVTPDSFYDASRKQSETSVIEQAERMLNEGADILDIGGQSTRPGSMQISADEEAGRVLPAVITVIKNFPSVFISVDTYHAAVAQKAVDAGASIVNDISAGNMDPRMLSAVAKLNVPYICMHMKGTPQNMHEQAIYDNLTTEVLDFFIKKIEECSAAGIKDVIVDPGFGFAKNISQNFLLLKEMSVFQMLGKPVMAGLSRKSAIYKTLGITPADSLNGTTVLNTLALQNGASILRVHDVKEARETIALFERYSTGTG